LVALTTQFGTARSNIEPDEDDKSLAPGCHEEVREALQGAESLQELGLHTILIGSYRRKVSIRRVKDVDVFCELPELDSETSAPDLLALFGSVLEDKFHGRLYAQDRSWTIDGFEGTDLQVDVVPARRRDDHWEIPKKDGGWEETNPDKLRDLTERLNGDHDALYVPTVKLIRQIRRIHVGDNQPGGLYFEILTLHAFNSGEVATGNQAEALTTTLEQIVHELDNAISDGLEDPTIDGKLITTRSAIADLTSARSTFASLAADARSAYDSDDECEAARVWQSMLGKQWESDDFVFPLPDGCDVEGARAAARLSPPTSRGRTSTRYG